MDISKNTGFASSEEDAWIVAPVIRLPKISQRVQWLGEENLLQPMIDSLIKHDKQSKPWIVLLDINKEVEHVNPGSKTESIMVDEFRRFYCVFVKRGKIGEFVESLQEESTIRDDFAWPAQFYIEEYSSEDHLCDIWDTCQLPDGAEFAYTTADYDLESGIDKRFPNAFKGYAPHKWLLDKLGLIMSGEVPNAWMNKRGDTVIRVKEVDRGKAAIVLDMEFIHSLTSNSDLEPVWVMTSSRSVILNQENENLRKLEGIVWSEDASWKGVGRDLDNPQNSSTSQPWSDLSISF